MNKVFYSSSLGINVMQVTKTKARKAYESGKAVYLHPCKMMFDSVWQSPIRVEMPTDRTPMTLDALVSHFEYYNCDSERGSYAHYFLEA